MQQNFQTTRTAGNGANVGPGYPPNASWSDPDGVTGVGDPASIGFFEGGQNGDNLQIDQFGFELPDFAVIDGISISITGSNTGCYGEVNFGNSFEDMDTLNKTYGSSTELWDEVWTPAMLNDASNALSVSANDVSGGDGSAEISLVEMTVYWHIDLETAPADVPTRVDYKMFSREGRYLGLLPNVSSPFGFSQDKDSAGSTIEVTCGYKAENTVTTEPLLTDDDDEILTDDDLPILAESTDIVLAEGASTNDAIFKNSNRLQVWVYNYWHPNGKLMFSGQVNKVGFQYGGGNSSVKLLVISDGVDLNNFIARGFPFSYTTDVTQSSQNGYVTVTQDSKGAGWNRYGQTWLTGGAVTNVGAITLKLLGTANVTLSLYDGLPGFGGNLLGSVTKAVANGAAADVQFEFPQLITVSPSTEYFMAVSVNNGKSVRVYRHSTSSTYPNGTMYNSSYSGGSGGGLYYATTGDFYFITKSGVPTTTTTYTADDPTTEMMSGILADYNARGGLITQRDFEATGLSITYTFIMATIYDALRKVIELSPTGFYSYIDLGTAEMDILQQTDTADFTVVRGKDVNQLDIVLSIENVKNYLLFTGGETAPNVNLYRDYQDSESASFYGLRTVARTDNRVTTSATADAIGNTFVEEESDETQETSITIPVTAMDTTLLVPGKNIGFRNFGSFIDSMVLQIVRREFNTKAVTLTLGRLPVRMNDQIQRINRGLLNEQTVNNPSSPS